MLHDPRREATTRERRPDGSRHGPVAQLLLAWAPLSLILLAYAAAQWVSAPIGDGYSGGRNRLGLALHVAGPAEADRALFGVVPSVWLQERLLHGTTRWYDAVASLVYVTHFLSVPLVTALVWFRWRDRFAVWVGAVIGFTVVGVGGYILYPAAPPWLASDLGVIGAVRRFSSIGWHYLQLGPVAHLTASGQGASNPVASMPSLHAGAPMLITLFLWPILGRRWRAALAAYVVLMALTLVYTGEHYVVDVVAGWATAAVAVAVVAAVERRRRLLSESAPARRGGGSRHRSGWAGSAGAQRRSTQAGTSPGRCRMLRR
jgi:membrane-associated phospholipid phosphatase